MKELTDIHNKGIKIHLVTTDDTKKFPKHKENDINKLIIQNTTKDDDADNKRNHWLKLSPILYYSSIGLTFISFLSAYFFSSVKPLSLMLLAIILHFFRNHYENKAKNKWIFNYSYEQLFPFKVYLNEYKGKFLLLLLILHLLPMSYLCSPKFATSERDNKNVQRNFKFFNR